MCCDYIKEAEYNNGWIPCEKELPPEPEKVTNDRDGVSVRRRKTMSRILPILFNTDMVRAIMDGRKTVTRRKMKEISKQPYHPGDILYVRETICPNYFDENIVRYITGMCGNRNAYKADYHRETIGNIVPEPKWIPSIHMPKEAARIWLKVTDIRAERLQDLTVACAIEEGFGSREECITAIKAIYPGSTDDTWMWAIEFERCEKPKPCVLEGMLPAEKGSSCMGYGTAGGDEACQMCKRCE